MVEAVATYSRREGDEFSCVVQCLLFPLFAFILPRLQVHARWVSDPAVEDEAAGPPIALIRSRHLCPDIEQSRKHPRVEHGILLNSCEVISNEKHDIRTL